MIKEVYVSDAFRAFADALDRAEPEQLDAFDPLGVRLTQLCDALGQYSRRLGVDLRYFSRKDVLIRTPILCGELRRFADAVDKKQDDLKRVDPGLKRLASAMQFIKLYASDLGVDIGLGGGVAGIANKKIEGRL